MEANTFILEPSSVINKFSLFEVINLRKDFYKSYFGAYQLLITLKQNCLLETEDEIKVLTEQLCYIDNNIQVLNEVIVTLETKISEIVVIKNMRKAYFLN